METDLRTRRINLRIASLLLFSVVLLSSGPSGDPFSPYTFMVGTLATLALAASAVRYPRRAPAARVLVFRPGMRSLPSSLDGSRVASRHTAE